MATPTPPSPQLLAHLKSLFTTYHQTASIPARARFYSPQCMQICRPRPSYAARNSQTIIRYLHKAAGAGMDFSPEFEPEQQDREIEEKGRDFTFRALREGEFEFGTDEVTMHVGLTDEEMRRRAEEEGWVGARVDLLFPTAGVDVADSGEGEVKGGMMLVKVKYWWRKEGEEWVQILHDIMYMGAPDGTEQESMG